MTRRLACLATLTLVVACSPEGTGEPGAGDDDTGLASGGGDDGGASGDDGGSEDGDDGGEGEAEVHDLDADTLASWLDAGEELLLINVHTPYAGEIPGTDVHIAYTDTVGLTTEIGGDLDRKVVVYCKSGPMSASAARYLVDLEYRGIWDLTEGMNGWEAAGHSLD